MPTNNFKSVGSAIVDSGGGIVYGPVGSGKEAVVHSIYVSNIDGANSANVDIKVRNTSGDAYRHVAKGVPVPAGSSLVLDKPIDLAATGDIHMEASVSGDLETNLGILEITL
jgi:hypothetical protein